MFACGLLLSCPGSMLLLLLLASHRSRTKEEAQRFFDESQLLGKKPIVWHFLARYSMEAGRGSRQNCRIGVVVLYYISPKAVYRDNCLKRPGHILRVLGATIAIDSSRYIFDIKRLHVRLCQRFPEITHQHLPPTISFITPSLCSSSNTPSVKHFIFGSLFFMLRSLHPPAGHRSHVPPTSSLIHPDFIHLFAQLHLSISSIPSERCRTNSIS